MRAVLATSLLVAVLAISLLTSARAFTIGSNVKVIDDSGTAFPAGDQFKRQQNEPWITADPSMPGVVVAGSNDYRGVPFYHDSWAGYYRSTNFGATWSNNLVPGFPTDTSAAGVASPIHGLGSAGDPMMEFDSSGTLYYVGIAFNRGTSVNGGGNQINSDNENAVWVAKYTNHGATYDHTSAVDFGSAGVGIFDDKPCIAVDTTGGPTDGNVYVAFTAFLGNAVKPDGTGVGLFGGERLMFSASYDHGATFTNARVTAVGSQDGTILLQGCSIAVAPNGDVYIAYRTFASADLFQPTTREFDFVKSTDAGKHFSTPGTITPFIAIPNPLGGNQFRTPTFAFIEADSFGVYLAYQYNPPGADRAEIGLQRSTNGGSTWSFTPVNDVSTGDQFFPAISVSNGVIHITYYSNQNDSPNFNANFDIYYTQSTDHGVSFIPATKVTNVPHNPNFLMFGGGTAAFHGDYDGLASTSTNVYAIWTDNRDFVCPASNTGNCLNPAIPNFPANNIGNRNQNIYSATITLP